MGKYKDIKIVLRNFFSGDSENDSLILLIVSVLLL